LPVVVSNKVNIWRDIEKAAAGLVVNTDPAELATAMERLLHDPQLAEEMGARGGRLVRENFSWRVAGDRLLQMYQDILSSKRVRLPSR
jgi:glycosyltransferase involved in cell wall biosynthesis